ncbi:MAG: mechanosensitive ion channel [Saprospiraceae bacterium]
MSDFISLIEKKLNPAIDNIIIYFPKVLLVIVILIIGFWIIKRFVKAFEIYINKLNISNEIKPLIKSIVSITLKAILVFLIMGILGIETSIFVASLAAISFAIGMAFQGALGHLASGFMIFIFRPYKIGDYIKVQENEGYVQEIQLFNTIIKNLDNELILIPNGNIFGDVIVNSSTYDNVRQSFTFHIPYGTEFKKVKNIVFDALNKTDMVLKEPQVFIGIKEFDTHTIILEVKFYSLIQDKEQSLFNATESVKKALGQNHIQMAYSEGIELGEIAE